MSRSHQNEGWYRHKNGWRHLKRFSVLPQLHGWAVLSQVELGANWGTTQFPAYCESIFRLLLKIAVGWGTRCVYINFWNHFFFNIKNRRACFQPVLCLTFWTGILHDFFFLPRSTGGPRRFLLRRATSFLQRGQAEQLCVTFPRVF